MNEYEFTKEQYAEMETAVYNIFDSMHILKVYCGYYKDTNPQLSYLESFIDHITSEFDKIAAKF